VAALSLPFYEEMGSLKRPEGRTASFPPWASPSCSSPTMTSRGSASPSSPNAPALFSLLLTATNRSVI